MKKILILTAALVLLSFGTIEANNKFIIYNDNDLTIGFNDISTCLLYDFKAKETLGGVKTSIIEYKKFNLDVGAIGDWHGFHNVDAFVGVSYDIPMAKLGDHFYTAVGAFVSPGIIDREPSRYGVYGELGIKF